GIGISSDFQGRRNPALKSTGPRLACGSARSTTCNFESLMALTATTTLDRKPVAAVAAAPSISTICRADIAWLALWMTGTLISFTVVAVSVRALAGGLSAFEMNGVRSAFGVAVMLALMVARPALRHELSLRRLRLHALRNTLHFASQIG